MTASASYDAASKSPGLSPSVSLRLTAPSQREPLVHAARFGLPFIQHNFSRDTLTAITYNPLQRRKNIHKTEENTMKREDYISWDEYFMGIAMLAARRSKDPNTQVGACIVSQDNIIISTGYNGMPKGCSDDEYPWEREGDETKYPYVVHAELNAILNANGRDLRGSRLYVALFPCNECAKAIIQSGVKEVLYLSDKYNDTMLNLASKRMLQSAGVKFTQLRPQRDRIVLDFIPEEERRKAQG